MHMPKPPLDPDVDDAAPEIDGLTPYDHYPCSQHVSCAGDRVQRIDSFRLSAKRRDETGSDLIVGRDGTLVTRDGSFPTIDFECCGQRCATSPIQMRRSPMRHPMGLQ
jgi:hypothetical protein